MENSLLPQKLLQLFEKIENSDPPESMKESFLIAKYTSKECDKVWYASAYSHLLCSFFWFEESEKQLKTALFMIGTTLHDDKPRIICIENDGRISSYHVERDASFGETHIEFLGKPIQSNMATFELDIEKRNSHNTSKPFYSIRRKEPLL